ncbi:cupin domain-containing protein [Saccharopolyspora shandongensis]|uniref:cupin domain-containing protein n=1 Tax=Saccharopolyspora shandongensis TaxID=418495 RepID=UPI0033F54A09
MDPFDDLLRGTGFSRTDLSPPWALRFGDAESLTLLAPLRGGGWISFEEGEKPQLVRAGDTAIRAARGRSPSPTGPNRGARSLPIARCR